MQPRNFGRMQPMGMLGPPGPQRGGGLFGPPAFGGMPPGAQGMNRGGLLSRLFQRQEPMQAGRAATGLFSRAPQAGGGSFLQGITNPGTINSFLNNTQHVLRAAQQIGPMVQQYGPLVRNLPAMWKLYKGFKDTPAAADNDEKEGKASESSSRPLIEAKEAEQESSEQRTRTSRRGESRPKLYI